MQQKISPEHKCAIHKDGCLLADEFRKEVCNGLPAEHAFEGKLFCVLHLPDENKSKTTNFLKVVEERINNNQNDFSYIFLPDNEAFYKKKLSGVVKFNWATFVDEASFGEAIFDGKVDFIHTVFEQGADFDKAVFKQDVCFNYAEFKEVGAFRETKFNSRVSFWNTVFSTYVFFGDAKFFQNANFGRTKFGNTNFDRTIFHKGAQFPVCEFDRHASFSKTDFKEGGNFADAIFNDRTFFLRTIFRESVDFGKVKFTEGSQIDFHETIFKDEVYFTKSIIEGYMEFSGTFHQPIFFGNNVWSSLEQARVEKAKRISFKNTRLRPAWFTNVDLKKFIFLDVDWENADGGNKNTNAELKALYKRKITGRPHRLLTITCRQLAVNYEDYNHYEQASNFRRMAMDLVFWEKWLSLKIWLAHPLMFFIVRGEIYVRRYKIQSRKVYERWKRSKRISFSFWQSFDIPHYIYRTLSFYGESWERALIWFISICPIFALLYFLFGSFESNKILGFMDSLTYSLQVMSLQKPEPKPIGFQTTFIYSLEIIFTTIQAALLALAIRRKFMR